jgi:quinol monooxygenase YgiN
MGRILWHKMQEILTKFLFDIAEGRGCLRYEIMRRCKDNIKIKLGEIYYGILR